MQISLLAGIHASHSAPPESEEARKMIAISGQKCFDLLKLSGRDGLLPRMLLDTSVWGSTRRYLTWKTKTTPGGRLLFQLAPSMPGIDETGSGLWPTPVASDYKGARKPETMALTGRNPDTNSLPDAVEFRGEPGRLNPQFVEWLMGFPIGWTELNH